MDAIYQIPGHHHALGISAERLITLHEAADAIGSYYWQIQRAVKRGDIAS